MSIFGKRLCASQFIVAFLAALPADAQDIDGKFRLGLEGTLLSSETVTVSSEEGVADPGNPAAGSTREIEVNTAGGGLTGSGLGVVLGYGVSDSVVLGARALWAVQSRELNLPGSEPAESEVIGILPYVEYVFSSGGVFRPFLQGTAGVRFGESRQGDIELASFSQQLLGAGFGAHVFGASSFSIDPMLSFYAVSARETVSEIDFEGSGSAVVLSVALSGWLGGSVSAAPARTPASPAAAPPLSEPARPLQPAAGTQPAAAREVAEAERVTVKRGVVTVRMALSGKTELRLAGDRWRDATTAVVSLTAFDRPDLEACGTLRFVVDGAAHEARDVRYREHGSGHGKIPALQGTLGVDALRDAAGTADSGLVACGHEWELDGTRRERIRKFVEVLQRGASAAVAPAESAVRDGGP